MLAMRRLLESLDYRGLRLHLLPKFFECCTNVLTLRALEGTFRNNKTSGLLGRSFLSDFLIKLAPRSGHSSQPLLRTSKKNEDDP